MYRKLTALFLALALMLGATGAQATGIVIGAPAADPVATQAPAATEAPAADAPSGSSADSRHAASSRHSVRAKRFFIINPSLMISAARPRGACGFSGSFRMPSLL